MARSCSSGSSILEVATPGSKSVSESNCTSVCSISALAVFLGLTVLFFDSHQRLAEHFVKRALLLQSDFTEGILLGQHQRVTAHQFEHSQEQADHGTAAALTLEQLGGGKRLAGPKLPEYAFQITDHIGDTDIFFPDFVNRPVLGSIQHGLQRLHQVE